MDQMGCYVVGQVVGDEVSPPCGAAGWMEEEESHFGDTLDSSSVCWSYNFIHAPSVSVQAAAQAGHDCNSQPSPTLGSLGWPGAVYEKYLEPTLKLLVL